MIGTVDFRGRSLSKAEYRDALPRAPLNVAEAMELIAPILARVAKGDEEALLKLAEEFDGVRPASIQVPKAIIEKALQELDPKIRSALDISIARIKKVHEKQRREESVTE